MSRPTHSGTPNPALESIKTHVRTSGGWSAQAWLKPATRRRPQPAPTMQVFALWHQDRRFIVRAPTLEAAQQLLTA